jgi:rhodanese-related sulfurtransferase
MLFMVLLVGAAADEGLAGQTHVNISAAQAKQMLDSDHSIFLLDVRKFSEYVEAHIAGAVNIRYDTISDNLNELPSDLNAGIIVYCQSGSRSAIAAITLDQKGFTNVSDMTGGLDAWNANCYPTVAGPSPYPTTTTTPASTTLVTSPDSNSTEWSSLTGPPSCGTCISKSARVGNTSQGGTAETSPNTRTPAAPFILLVSVLGIVAFLRRLRKT